MLLRHCRSATLLSGIALAAITGPAAAQNAAPAPSPVVAAPTSQTATEDDVCNLLGLSPESEAALQAPAVTETAASTAGTARAAGVTTTPSASASPTQTPRPTPASTATPATPPATAASKATRCKRGIAEARSDRASLNRALAARPTLEAAARSAGIDWRILAAIGIRESNFKNASASDGGEGIFQLTKQPGVTKAMAWDINRAAPIAAKLYASELPYLRGRCKNFNEAQIMQAALATYNFGRISKKSGKPNISCNPNAIDQGTTRNNYGRNVMDLMQCF